ncbi:MAG TPA: helix-turn-helix transcriptional regulator [Virgibacillus sp.]|nr:helix-turn-helix transcriptional regulator [Virgibacillus sp.]
MDTKRIGRRIKAFRKLKSFTQADLAREMAIPIAQLGSVERGTEQASDVLLSQIATTLNVDKKELISEDVHSLDD